MPQCEQIVAPGTWHLELAVCELAALHLVPAVWGLKEGAGEETGEAIGEVGTLGEATDCGEDERLVELMSVVGGGKCRRDGGGGEAGGVVERREGGRRCWGREEAGRGWRGSH